MYIKLLGIIFVALVSVVIYLSLPKAPLINQPIKTLGGPELNNITLDIDKIFSTDHTWINKLPTEKIRTAVATGDIIPARSVNSKVLQYKNFNWPYLKTTEVLKNADITFINLETPLIENCPVTSEGMVFCGDVRNVEGLTFAGVDIASLANNHAGNYGTSGVEKTKELLNKNGIMVTGLGGEIILDIRGIKFAFLGFNDVTKPQPGISNVEEEKVKEEITNAKTKADVVIVTFHWGTEYQAQPDQRQKYLGHLAIDAGADLIIGNHPHWIQPVEIYKDKLITYAHGNFIFDQEWSQKTREGVVGKYTFYDKELIDVEFLPVLIEDYGQPYFLDKEDKSKILEEMKQQSEKLFL